MSNYRYPTKRTGTGTRTKPRPPVPADHPITATQARVLVHLYVDDGKLPYELYPVISPHGRFNTEKDYGNTKGGPSRTEYAVNMYMGRMESRGWVRRYGYLDKLAPPDSRGKWVLTNAGIAMVESAHLLAVSGLTKRPVRHPKRRPTSPE